MPTVAPTYQELPPHDGSIVMFSWTPLTTTNPDGAPIEFAQWADRCVQLSGTWGVGGTAKFQGSNDGTNWFDLSDAQTVAISKTANALEQVVEVPRYARPYVSAGDGNTSITATLVCRRANTMRA